MHSPLGWFTSARRQQIQVFAGSLAPFFILFGIGSEGQWEQWLILLGLILQFGSSLLSLLALKVGDWGTGWAIVRGAVYALGMGAAPALVALGVWDKDFSSFFLVGLSLGLAALSNLVAIFTSGHQRAQATIVAELRL